MRQFAPEIHPASAERTTSITSHSSASSLPASHGGARILLADDLDLNRKLITDMLSIEGYDVDSVANGAAAVRALETTLYDLVLMDIMMPEMDGLAATRAIRALQGPASKVPIIALTADAFPENVDTYLDAGMDDVLAKPMTMDSLTAIVSRWTRGRHAAA